MAKHSNSLDVARLAGVSQTTVSFVLNKRPGHSISAETRERVLNAAQTLQYRSNRLSEGLFRGSTGLIGVVMPLMNDDYYTNILSSVASYSSDNEKTVLFSPLNSGNANNRDPLLQLIEYRVDGIILVCQESVIDSLGVWLTELTDKHICCVVVDDRKYQTKVPCVVSDDIRGANQVVSYLASLGHRNIAHLSAGTDSTTAVDRLNGFVSGMNELGVPPSDLVIKGTSYASEEGRAAAKELLNSVPRPTAIFAANDILAAEALKVIRSLELKCPEDVSVVGYGNTQVAQSLDLTSVDQHPMEIGRIAIETLLDILSDHEPAEAAVVIGCDLICRGTSGPNSAV